MIENGEFHVSRVQVEYYIKFKGYPDSDNLWEPINSLNCPRLIREFEESLKINRRRSRKVSEFFEYEKIIGKRISSGKVNRKSFSIACTFNHFQFT